MVLSHFYNCLYFSISTMELKKILIPNLASSHIVFSLFLFSSLFFPTFLVVLSANFRGRSLNEQLPQQAWLPFTGQPTNRGTLVQDGCLLFGDNQLCDKSSPPAVLEIPDSTFLPNFPAGNPSYWAHSLQISIYNPKMKLFASSSIFVSKREEFSLIIRGGVVFGFCPLHEICCKYVLPKSTVMCQCCKGLSFYFFL